MPRDEDDIWLIPSLMKVGKNSKNPICNRYLFESVAILIQWACKRDPSLISAFEERLLFFPAPNIGL
jgi:hypothetical protein